MRTLRYAICISAALLFSSALAFSQANISTFDLSVNQFVPCANDGAGELVSGVIQIHVVERDGFFVAHPQGGELTGQDTGITYRPTGVTKESSGDNGFTFVNRFHLVGKGTQFFVKETIHVTVNANGDVTAEFFNSELICK